VLLNGGGFDGPEWSVRISMANLMMPAYEQIGSWLAEAVVEYKAEFDALQTGTAKAGAAKARTAKPAFARAGQPAKSVVPAARRAPAAKPATRAGKK
jgi:aspartate 4-decarboxylase